MRVVGHLWVASVVAQTEASATIAPTDRSMPPPMITKVMPTVTTPMTEASRRMVRTLSTLAKRSPAVATPDDAQDDERDDQAEVAADRTRAARAPTGAALPARAVGRPLGRVRSSR